MSFKSVLKRQNNRLNVQRDASGSVQFQQAISSQKTVTGVTSASPQTTSFTATKQGNFVKAKVAVTGLGATDTGTAKMTISYNNGTTTTSIGSSSTTGQQTTTATLTTTMNSPVTPVVNATGSCTTGTGSLKVTLGVGAKIEPEDTTTTLAIA